MVHDAPPDGSAIFLHRSSTSRMSLKSCLLAEVKYAILSRTGRKTEKLWPSNLFPSTMFKHGLLEGSTILFQYSYTSRTPLKSSQLGELKYAVAAGCDVRLKKSLGNCKKIDIARQAYRVTVL